MKGSSEKKYLATCRDTGRIPSAIGHAVTGALTARAITIGKTQYNFIFASFLRYL